MAARRHALAGSSHAGVTLHASTNLHGCRWYPLLPPAAAHGCRRAHLPVEAGLAQPRDVAEHVRLERQHGVHEVPLLQLRAAGRRPVSQACKSDRRSRCESALWRALEGWHICARSASRVEAERCGSLRAAARQRSTLCAASTRRMTHGHAPLPCGNQMGACMRRAAQARRRRRCQACCSASTPILPTPTQHLPPTLKGRLHEQLGACICSVRQRCFAPAMPHARQGRAGGKRSCRPCFLATALQASTCARRNASHTRCRTGEQPCCCRAGREPHMADVIRPL